MDKQAAKGRGEGRGGGARRGGAGRAGVDGRAAVGRPRRGGKGLGSGGLRGSGPSPSHHQAVVTALEARRGGGPRAVGRTRALGGPRFQSWRLGGGEGPRSVSDSPRWQPGWLRTLIGQNDAVPPFPGFAQGSLQELSAACVNPFPVPLVSRR